MDSSWDFRLLLQTNVPCQVASLTALCMHPCTSLRSDVISMCILSVISWLHLLLGRVLPFLPTVHSLFPRNFASYNGKVSATTKAPATGEQRWLGPKMTSIKLKHILIVCGASSLLMIYMFLGVQRSRSSLVLAAREDVVDSLQSYARGDNLSKQPVKVKRTVDKGRQATVARLHSLTDSWASVSSEDLPQCKDFLNSVKHGRWVHRKPPLEQNLRDLNHQISDLRTEVLGIPSTLQRADHLCGNVSYPGTKLRALCHPEGATPCCAAENTCVARSMDQCRCQTCWDLRRDFHADLAEFLPRDVSCHVGRYTGVEQVQVQIFY